MLFWPLSVFFIIDLWTKLYKILMYFLSNLAVVVRNMLSNYLFLYTTLIFQIPVGLSDTEHLSTLLANAAQDEFPDIFAQIRGPFAFIYFHLKSGRIYFGRDIFGRHSLLMSPPDIGKEFTVTSVGHQSSSDSLTEVPALGLFYISIHSLGTQKSIPLNLIPWDSISNDVLQSHPFIVSEKRIRSPISPLNKSLPSSEVIEELQASKASDLPQLASLPQFDRNVSELLRILTVSIERRVRACPKCCILCTEEKSCGHCRVAVLFSGGVDSAVLALLLDRSLPAGETIDLINVAFPLNRNNEQSTKAKKRKSGRRGQNREQEGLNGGMESLELKSVPETEFEAHCPNKSSPKQPEELEVSFKVPDRVTGRECYKQLLELCPARKWNFVEVILIN